MPRKLDEQNRSAPRVNPVKSGVRTGNPQLADGSGTDGEAGKSRRLPRRKVRVKSGERRGG